MSNILVIDNNEHISSLVKDILANNNYNVDCAYNGLSALNLIDQNEYELIFVDLDLPDTNGLNLINRIRETSPNTMTIIISAHYDFDCAIESIKAGVYQYIKKPFDIDEISKVAETAIEERKRMVSSGYVYKYKDQNDKQNMIKNIVRFSLIATIAALALLSGFIMQKQIYNWQRIPSFWGNKEIMYLLLSFVCCYGFISIAFYRRICYSGKINHYISNLKYLTFSYILFMAIMYIATTLYEARLAIFIGYGLGVVGLYINDLVLIPRIMKLLSSKHEGSRKLIIKGFRKRATSAPGTENDKITKPVSPLKVDLESAITESADAGINKRMTDSSFIKTTNIEID